MPTLAQNDYGTAYSNYTLPNTQSESVPHGAEILVGWIYQNLNEGPVVSCSYSDVLVGANWVTGARVFRIPRPGLTYRFICDKTNARWIVDGPPQRYQEVFEFIGLDSSNLLIWEFVPSDVQTKSDLVSLIEDSAGQGTTFSFNLGLQVSFSLTLEVSYEFISGDPTVLSLEVEPQFFLPVDTVDTGNDRNLRGAFPRLIDSMCGVCTGSFPRSLSQSGAVEMEPGSQFSLLSGLLDLSGTVSTVGPGNDEISIVSGSLVFEA